MKSNKYSDISSKLILSVILFISILSLSVSSAAAWSLPDVGCDLWNYDSTACESHSGCTWQDSCYGSVSCSGFGDSSSCSLYGCSWDEYCSDLSCTDETSCGAPSGGCDSNWNAGYCDDGSCIDQSSCEDIAGCDSVWNAEYCDDGSCIDQSSCEALIGCGTTWNAECTDPGYDCSTWNDDYDTCTGSGCSWQDSCGGTTDPSYCGGTVPCNCSNGAIVLNESRKFTASDNVASCSDGLMIYGSNIVLDCDNYAVTGDQTSNAIQVMGNNVTIKNCVISNYSDGITFSSYRNLTVENNTIYDLTGKGVYGEMSSSWIKVLGNEMYNMDIGIQLYATYDGDIIADNYIHNITDTGMMLSWMINANIYNNVIDGTTSGYGIDTSLLDSSNLTNNTITNCYLSGLYLSDSDNNIIRGGEIGNNNLGSAASAGLVIASDSFDNTITEVYMHNNTMGAIYVNSDDNTIDGNNIIYNCGNLRQIYVGSVDNIRIQNNNITNGTGYGIEVSCSSNLQVLNNDISYNGQGGSYTEGIRMDSCSSSSNNIISGNTFTGNEGYGMYVINELNMSVSDNDFDSNADGGIYGSTADFNVTNGNFINDVFDEDYYGLQTSSSTVYWIVTEPVTCTNSSIDISGSVDDIDSVTRTNCPVYLNGACVSGDCPVDCGTTITEDLNLTYGMECSDTGLVVGASDITIDCKGHSIIGTDGVTGIRSNSYSNVTIKNCEIYGFDNGILSSNGDYNNIINNNIHNNSQYNIGIRNADNYTVSGNQLSYATAGLRVSNSNQNDIYNNTIFDNTDDIGHGISVVASCTNNTIHDNTITGNLIGISYSSTSGESNSFTDNSIEGNCKGMYVYSSIATIEDSDFTSNSNYAMDICSTTAYTAGLYVESSSTVNITNGDFLNNGQFGIYSDSSSTVDWTLEQDQSCTNNMIFIDTGSFAEAGGNLTKNNCPMDVDGVSDTESAISCGDTIESDITLNQPLDCSGHEGAALTVGADNITIDCDGWAIFGNDEAEYDYGIGIDGYNGVTIKNCELDSSVYGIYIYNSSDDSILNNKISNTYYSGIYINAEEEVSDHTIKNNILKDTATNCFGECSGVGAIEINNEDNCLIENNTIVRGGYNGISLYETTTTRILSNTISDVYNMGIRLATNDEGYGGQNTVSGNTINDGCVGIRVGSEDNIITENTVTGDGTFSCSYWGNTYGMYTKSNVDIENNSFSGNGVSGYYYGHYLQNIVNFTVTGDTYNNNTYGMYLQSVGDSDTEVMPIINDTTMNDNADEGARVVSSSIVKFIDPVFERNMGTEGAETGLYISGATVYLTNGEFVDNAGYGLYDTPPVGTVYWTINSDAVCTNNDISINDGAVLISGGIVTADNCTITLSGEVVNITEDMSGFSVEDVNVGADNTGTYGDAENTGYGLELYSELGYVDTIEITKYDEIPTGVSGFSSEALGTWVEFDAAELAAGDWAIIKLYYTDAEVTAAGLDENTLFIQYYNNTSGVWESYDTVCGSAPCGGVNTTGNYVWANTTHFSGYGVFGSAVSFASAEESTSSIGGGISAPGETNIWSTDSLDAVMVVRDNITFSLNSETHTIKLMSLGADYVFLWISSETVPVTVKIGETKEVDVNKDGTNDISILLNKVELGKAYITFNKLAQPGAQAPAEQPAATAVPSEPTTAQPGTQPAAQPSSNNTMILVAAALLVIAIGAGCWILMKKKEA